jgi:ABC-2 type transport system ATP-binding protein
MMVVDVKDLSHRYGAVTALRGLDLAVPEGAFYALLGPNGAGKTTLLQLLMGLLRKQEGHLSLMGHDSAVLTVRERSTIGYIAEGQALPKWMRLGQLEAYLAPLYPSWDPALANTLRERFGLDAGRKIGTFSRGDYMKAALLCALAPRPKLLLMDEPFTGMDVLVKDELVRGLLDFAGNEGWSVVLSSHDIGELELLADWAGFLDAGRMQLSEPMEALRKRFRRIEIVLGDAGSSSVDALPAEWQLVEHSGRRVSFVVSHFTDALVRDVLPARFPGAARIEVFDVTLREVYLAMATHAQLRAHREEAA